MSVTIRPERPGDEAAIRALTAAAFHEHPHSDGSEPGIIDALRAAGDLTLSLVAVNMDQAVIGHVAFSPVTISDGATGWYGLGPVSVMPTLQRTGIGTMLIRQGLSDLRTGGARGCVLLGDPAYYCRFGFAHDPALTYPGGPAEFFQRLVFEGRQPSGLVCYSPAFGAGSG